MKVFLIGTVSEYLSQIDVFHVKERACIFMMS